MAFPTAMDYSARRHSSHMPMAPANRTHPLGVPHMDDEDSLDEAALEPAILSPDSAGGRRDSFATSSAALFSPQATWEDFSAPPLDRTHSLSSTQFFEQSNSNPFARQQAPGFPHQPTWPLIDRASESHTPFGHHNPNAFASAEMDAGAASYLPSDAKSLPIHDDLSMAGNVRPSSVFAPTTQDGDSPLSGSPDRWNAINGQDGGPRPIPKRMRQHSPPHVSTPGYLRRDGIRKKNARFEIPAERNLHTIDQMIADATNDDEVKELKQQKRLLRNRQAALDSRQRKKKHTEELEEEKKQWNERYSMLETDIESMRITSEQHAAERLQWQERYFQQQRQIETLMYEKEDLVAKHTLETGELRKRLNFLMEKLDARSSTGPVSVTPCSTEFTDFGLDMNGLAMDTDEWNNYILVDSSFPDGPDAVHTQDQPAFQEPVRPNQSMVVATRPKMQQPVSDADKPVASGLLFMLLLCGAFVASKSSGSQTPAIPRMPEDVRAASATVLDNIFKDAGVAATGSTNRVAHQLISSSAKALDPGPSEPPSTWRPRHRLAQPGARYASLAQVSGGHSGLGISGPHSGVEQMHQQLVMPTEEQEADHLFGMTPAQYTSLTNPDFGHPDPEGMGDAPTPPVRADERSASPLSGRKNLAQTLQRMRDASMGESAAEVYTRSLLWDRVPTDIVREFKKMVEESSRLAAGGEHSIKSEK